MKAALILAGQSNMLGDGLRAELDSAALPANVRLFDRNPRPGSFGPELGLARRVSELMLIDELWLIKYAVGGSSLLAWDPDWQPERAALADDAAKGPLYQRLIAHIKQVSRGQALDVKACLWMQGESDARYPLAAAQYEENLRQWIQRLRSDLGQPDLAFAIGLINPPGMRFPCRAQVRQAQRQVAKRTPKAVLVDTTGLSKHADDLHYDTDGQLELGRRFADALRAAQN